MFRLIKIFFREFFENLLEIIFPEFCVGCNKINSLLCHRCYETLEFIQFEIDLGNKFFDSKLSLDSINCCCYYEETAKKLIHEFKYKSVIAIGKTIAEIIYYNCNLPKFDLITFVPIHKKKLGQRGFNQTQIIACELSKLTNKPVAELLIKTKNTRSQMSLKQKGMRKINIENTIKINPKIPKSEIKDQESILIVDDVFTSGTTLNHCAKILKDFGFKSVNGACFIYKN